ncbi:MAG: FtsX-like permease family protein [Nocardioides sp.]
MTPLLPRSTSADRGFALLLTLLCAGIIVGTAGSSLWLRETSDELTRRVFAEAPHSATQLQVSYSAVENGEVPPTASDEVAAAVSPALDALYAEPRHAVVAPDFAPVVLPRRPGAPVFVTVASMPDVDGLVELVEGRLPRPGDSERRLPPDVAAEYQGPATAAVVEVILHVDAAIEADLPVGAWIEQSSLRYNPEATTRPTLVRVVGTYRAADPHPSPLDDVVNARRPAISVEPEGNLVRTTALAADEETVLRAGWSGQPDVLFTFDPLGTPSSAQSDRLIAEARQLRLQAWPPVLAGDDTGAQTGVGEIASAVATSRDTSNATAMLTLTSVAAAALVVLVAAAVVLATRRESMTGVMRARGASHRWLVAQRGAEALLIVVPGAAIALAMPAVISAGTPHRSDLLAAGAAALLCAVLITAAQTVPRGIGGERFQGVVRDALQLVMVTLAVTVTAVVLRRESLGPLDPLSLVMAPLVGAAGGVLVMRVLQLLVGQLRRTTRRSRTVAPIVGLSQTVTLSQQVVVACVAVVLAVSSAVLGVAVDDTLRANAERSGWEQVGADVVVHAEGLNGRIVDQVTEVAGVESVAAVFAADSISVVTRTGVEGVRLIGVDPEALARAGAGGPLQVRVPGPEDGELRALASPDLPFDDDDAQLRYAQSVVPLHITDRVERIPGVTNGESFVAVDLGAMAAAVDRTLEIYDVLLVTGDADLDEIASIVRERAPDAVVSSRAGVVDAQLGQPVVERTVRVLRAVSGVAALVAVFAVVLVVALGAPTRRRTSTLLRVIGADPRQARRSAVLGLVPVVAATCLAAAACGAVLTLVAGRGLDLAALTGTLASLPVRPGPVTTAIVGAGLLGLVVLVAAVAGRRTPQGEVALEEREKGRR